MASPITQVLNLGCLSVSDAFLFLSPFRIHIVRSVNYPFKISYIDPSFSLPLSSPSWYHNYPSWWLRWLRICPAMQETQVRFLGQDNFLEKEMATHSSTLAWRIPWTEEPGGPPCVGLQRVRHDWVTEHAHTCQWRLTNQGYLPPEPTLLTTVLGAELLVLSFPLKKRKTALGSTLLEAQPRLFSTTGHIFSNQASINSPVAPGGWTYSRPYHSWIRRV